MKKFPLGFIVLFFYLCSNEGLGKVPEAIILQKSKCNSIENSQCKKAQSIFLLSPHTNFIIDEGVIFTVSSDVILRSNVQGEGVFQIKGKRPLALDAHQFKINRFFVDNEIGLELKSPVTIGKELYIVDGSFYLNNFNITLDNYSIWIHSGKFGHLVFNGSGKLDVRNPNRLVLFSVPPYTSETPCYCDFLTFDLACLVISENFVTVEFIYQAYQLISPKPPP